MGKRLNIGLLIDDLDMNFTNEICRGAELAAMTLDANLYIYPGRYLDSDSVDSDRLSFEYQYNTIFDYARDKSLDIVYVIMGVVACRTDFDKQKEFLERYLGIPVVTLFSRIEGYSAARFNNKAGFSKAIAHLIKDHKVERIGFVSGPKTNSDAVERLDIYKQVLAEEGIAYDEKRVVYGTFEADSVGVIRQLMNQNSDLQAVVFASDIMALCGYPVFEELGLEIGKDILIASFDNTPEAVTASPALTTVEANPQALAYHALMEAEQLKEAGVIRDIERDSHFVRRASCGCTKFDYKGMARQLGLCKLKSENTIIVERVYHYLFGDYKKGEELQQIKDDIAVFLNLLRDTVKEHRFDKYKKDLQVVFTQLIQQPLLKYTTNEKLFNTLISIHHELSLMLSDKDEKMTLMSIFSNFYKDLSYYNFQVVEDRQEHVEQLARLMNTMTSRLFLMESEDEIPYETALEQLSTVGIRRSYLYTYQQVMHNKRGDDWKLPKKLLLKAYCDEDGAVGLPLEQQLIQTSKILNNEYVKNDRRVTMVFSPLFSGEELYGVLVCELDYEHFKNLPSITFQLSAAIKSMLMLEQQREVRKKLEANLMKAKESNLILDEISKSDELTGLYNRRGFLEYAVAAITNKRNKGKKALIAYADMDNLKMINDKYGHDDGDFALCEIAAILKDTFRSTDIIGRYGGDEFVAFAMVGVENYENIMKRRVAEITARHNDACDVPYPIEMSIGIWEFECGPDVDIYHILDMADEKLYQEKAAKKAKNGSYR